MIATASVLLSLGMALSTSLWLRLEEPMTAVRLIWARPSPSPQNGAWAVMDVLEQLMPQRDGGSLRC